MLIDPEEREALKAALQMSVVDTTTTTTPATTSTSTADTTTTPVLPSLGTAFKDYPTGLPAEFTGQYELHSMVTHKGRSADSGHYIGKKIGIRIGLDYCKKPYCLSIYIILLVLITTYFEKFHFIY